MRQGSRTFPVYEELPEHVRDNLRRIFYNYREQMYDPECWKRELQQIMEYILKENKKADARDARRQAKLTQPKKKIPVEMPDELAYFPDLTYTLQFSNDVTDDMVEEIEAIMEDFAENREEYGLEILDISRTGDRVCEITVDFGQSPPSTVKSIVTVFEKSGLTMN